MRWYFDFISPYAYLQSTQLKELDSTKPVSCVPVLFAGLLKHWGQLGPAEIAPKRKWTFREITWLAHQQNIELTMPPVHPFNPLPLLRLSIVHNNRIEVVQRLFRFIWAEGNIPQEEAAFTALLQELGTDSRQLQSEQVKKQLQENGRLAISQGVFGVPTFEVDNELFWGHSSADMLKARLIGGDDFPYHLMKTADNLPEGQSRRTVSTPQLSAATPRGPRIPLKPIDLAEPADLVTAIRERRGGQLIELDRLLLYSRPLSEGWNHFLGNIRQHFSVPQVLRELAMCTVAVINNAEYEYAQHAPLYIQCGGTEEKANLIRQPQLALQDPTFNEAEQLTIALTSQLTKDVKIDDELFQRAVNHFDYEHLVELIATIAAYNMVSRFLVAFELHP